MANPCWSAVAIGANARTCATAIIGQDVKMSFLIRKTMRPRSAPSSSIQNGLDAESAERFLRSVSMPPWPQDSRDSRWARRLPGFRCIKPEAMSRSSALKCRLRTAPRFLWCAWLRQLAVADPNSVLSHNRRLASRNIIACVGCGDAVAPGGFRLLETLIYHAQELLAR